jgi:hypothetical protein
MMAANLDRCEVPGCPRYATQTHEIWTRGANGNKRARVPVNMFRCCGDHHNLSGDSWHVKGRDSFAEDHGLEDRVLRARILVKGY